MASIYDFSAKTIDGAEQKLDAYRGKTLLVVVTVLPYLTGMSGLFYLGGALVLGAGFLYYAIRLLNPPDDFFPMRVFNYSIVYLMALFAFLLVDHYLMPTAFQPGGLTFKKVG